MQGLIDYFLNRSIFVNLLTVILIGVGGFIALTMNREAFPNIDFDIVSVNTIYPGASPQEVEKLVTIPLEESIKEVDGLEEYRSSSIESRSGIVIQIDPDEKDTQKVIDDIRSAVDRTEDLPEDAEDPLIIEIGTSRTPVIEWSLVMKPVNGVYPLSYGELRELARRLENRFLELDEVARVERKGWRDREIFVETDPDLLQRYYLGTGAINNALKARNVSLPGGEINLGKREVIVRTVGEYENAEEIRRTYVRSNEVGYDVKVADVAQVRDDFEEPDYLETTLNHPSISLVVVKREAGDIINVVDKTNDIVERFRKNVPEGIELVAVNDISYFVKRRLGVLISNGIVGLALVILSLFFFMGWRTSVMVALGIPIAFGMTFIAMQYLGVTMNLISMFGLVLVIGIVVDDAIIVSENIYRYMEEGYPLWEACSKGSAEVVSPVMATIATTCAAFAPMMFMTGIFGKFVYTIPLVVILALIASLLECFLILPSHVYDMNKYSPAYGGDGQAQDPGKQNSGKRSVLGSILGSLDFVRNAFERLRDGFYRSSLWWMLRHRGLVIAGMFMLFIFAIFVQAVFGKFKLFPAAVDQLYVKVTLPSGTTKEETQRFLHAVGIEIEKLPESELDTFLARSGIQQKEANDPFTKRGSNYGMLKIYLEAELDRDLPAQIIIDHLRNQTEWMLTPEALRDKKARDLENIKRMLDEGKVAQAITQLPLAYDIPSQFADLRGRVENIEFEKMQGGPPVGKPVAIEIMGDNMEVLDEIADRYKEVLASIDGIVDIDDSNQAGKDEIRLKIDEAVAARTNLSVAQIASAVNTAFEGTVATSIKTPEEEVDIRVRFAEKNRNDLNSLNKIYVQNQLGNLIPVSSMAAFERTKGITAILHLDGRRLISVTANVDENKITSAEATEKIREAAKDIPDQYPSYQVQFGGENKDTEESLGSLGRAAAVGVIVIFMILASLFRSLTQPFVVLAAVPFAMIGVIFAFAAHGEPFSFLALMGIIGLAGVVVNDSIVLVDFANRIRVEQPELSNIEVALEASSLRFRAVLLTTLTTVLGLLPTAYGLGGFDPFLVPMALSFAWGLAFSTVLTLGMVPIMYSMALDVKEYLGRKVAGKSVEEMRQDMEIVGAAGGPGKITAAK